MEKSLIQREISSETIWAVFIIASVSLFILANFAVGFILPLYFLAAFLGFAISFRYPKSGLLAIIFLTIIFERFFTLQSLFIAKTEYKIYLVDFLMLGMIFRFILDWIGGKIKLKKIIQKFDWILFGFIALNFIYFFLSVFVWGSDAFLSFSSLKNYAFYSLLYFIAIYLIESKADLKRIFNFFLAGTLGILGFILFGILNGEGLWTQFTPLSTEGVRILAFTHGLYLSLAVIPLLLFLIFKNKRGRAWLIIILIWIVGIAGTLMRHLWVSLFATAVFIYFMLPRNKKAAIRSKLFEILLPLAALAAIGLFLSLILPQSQLSHSFSGIYKSTKERAFSIVSANADESFAWRSLAWNSGYEKFKANPILGIGTGQKISVEKEAYRDFVEIRNIHNSYLAIIFQLGTIGLVLFAGFIYQALKNLLRFPEKNFYQLSVLSVLLVYLVAFVFQPYLETNLLAIFFWIALGVGRVLPKIKMTKLII